MRRSTCCLCLALVLCGGAHALAGEPPAGSRGVKVIDPGAPVAPPPPSRASSAPPEPVPPPRSLLAAPTPAPVPAPPPAAKCTRAFAAADLAYSDTAAFDAALSARLTASSADRGVVIDTSEFAVDAPPPSRLAPWLSTVQTSGGDVGRRDITCSRGFSLMRMFKEMFTAPPKPDLYAPARGYNAILWVEPATGQVRQIQFTRRS